MKIGVFSDVHANQAALSAVLECMEKLNLDLKVCLGDIVGYNAEPKETLALVRLHADLVVAGNHDLDAFREASAGTRNAARMAQHFAARALDQGDKEYLQALPSHAVQPNFVAAHGSYLSDIYVSGYVTSTMLEENLLAIEQRATFPNLAFCGHTHVPMLGFLDAHGGTEEHALRTRCVWPPRTRAVLINPGAVGQPRDGDPRAAFAVVDTAARSCEVVRVPYDVERTLAAMRREDFPEELMERLREGR